MMRINKMCIWVAALSLFMGCGKLETDRRYPASLINNSNRKVEIIINNEGRALDPVYPDTVITERILKFFRSPEFVIHPNQKKVFYDGSVNWENVFKAVKNDTLSFLIFDTDTLDHYPPNVIREDYKIQQRYDLSLEDLQKLNYTLYYPPTAAMKDIKMWPRYMTKNNR